jgi:hypothetical protein
MRESIQRRVVGSVPDGNSALMLVAAQLRHIADTRWGTRRYLDVEKLQQKSSASEEDVARIAG